MTNPPAVEPHQAAETLRTSLDPAAIRQQLGEANRRGNLSEIEWVSENRFRLILPSRPMLSRLVGTIGPANRDGVREIALTIRPHRKQFVAFLFLSLACAVVGPWSTELFISVYSWWWQPPLCVLGTIWIAVIWPAQSREDAADLLPTRIGQMRKALQSEDSPG